LDIRRFLHAWYGFRVVLGTRDQKQNTAGDSKRAEWQKETEEPQYQPLSTNGIVDWTVQQSKERSNRLIRL